MKNFQMNQGMANRRDFIVLAAATCASAARAAQRSPVILVLGDSMSAEYGLPRDSGWVQLLRERLAKEKITVEVVNASVSGDTTPGGRSRLPRLLSEHQPTLVVIELGGNDALRGLPLKNTQENLAWMARQARAAGARVLLVGMQVPPNYGADYTRRFAATFETVATAEKTAPVPFLLAGIADRPDAAGFFQADRIHPNVKAQPLMLDNVWKVLAPLLR